MEWATAVEMDTEALRTELAATRAARDRMINSNLRLVISIAKRYTNRCAAAALYRLLGKALRVWMPCMFYTCLICSTEM